MSDMWPRYIRNGRLTTSCASCVEKAWVLHHRSDEARKRGYAMYSSTPEMRLQARRSEAERAGREFNGGKPRIAGMKADKIAYSMRVQAFRAILAEYRDTDLYKEIARQGDADKIRELYWKDPSKQRIRAAVTRYTKPSLKDRSNTKRRERMDQQGDGTATPEFIRSLFGKAKDCPYCGGHMNGKLKDGTRKSLDHIVSLASGGMHSAPNLLICCLACNQKKRTMTLTAFLGTLKNNATRASRKQYDMPLFTDDMAMEC